MGEYYLVGFGILAAWYSVQCQRTLVCVATVHELLPKTACKRFYTRVYTVQGGERVGECECIVQVGSV